MGKVTAPAVTVERLHPDNITPRGDWVWVFGSNLAGRHGKGAAAVARTNFQAEYGVGEGVTGNSYAIPTKGRRLEVLPLSAIEQSITAFLQHARAHPAQRFFVTRVGCGLAGYQDEQIAPLFAGAPANCSMPDAWSAMVGPAV
jgi:hypothetical protein